MTVQTLLIIAIILQAVLHQLERRDLYNRIMSADYREYKSSQTIKKPPKPKYKKILERWNEKRD